MFGSGLTVEQLFWQTANSCSVERSAAESLSHPSWRITTMSITAAALPARQRYSVVVPSRLAEGRPHTQPSSVVYIRRRLLVVFMLVAVVAVVWLGAGSVVANRGGDPASASAVRPTATYVVQPGDTLWSISSIHHGSHGVGEYVEMLVAANGNSTIAPGQGLVLP